MKLYLYLALAICGPTTTTTSAQSFTLDKDFAPYTIHNNANVHVIVTNKTSDSLSLVWNIYKHDFPEQWKAPQRFGMCDNKLCYSPSVLGDGTAEGPTRITEPVPPGKELDMKLQLTYYGDLEVPDGTHNIFIQIADTGTKLVDSFQYEITKNPTGVISVKAVENGISVYPNPAQNDINVLFDARSDIKNIAVYNLIGKAVNVYRVQGNSAKLDISNIPSGIYFLRFTDAKGHVVASRKFTHQ